MALEPRELHRRCGEIGIRSLGVIHLDEAFANGMSHHQVLWKLRTGEWRRVLPCTFLMSGVADSWDVRALAAVKYAGPGSALSFGASARIRGWRGFEDVPVEVSTIGRKRARGLGFKLHRCDSYLLREIETRPPFVLTTARRTVLDLFGCGHPFAERALDQGFRDGSYSLGDLWLLYEEEWIRGRRGCARLRVRLQERTPGLAPKDEDLAEELLLLIKKAKLPVPLREFPYRLPRYGHLRFDLAYSDRLLAIECDSYGFHGDRESFDRDRARDAEAALHGWLVLRFTWAQIRYQPDFVIETIRQHLAIRAPSQ
jgi:hypothetical protein